MNVNGLWKEEWKEIDLGVECTNKSTYEISNWGRIRSSNQMAKEKILKGSMTEGYRIVRLKLFKPRTEEQVAYIEELKSEISEKFKEKRSAQKEDNIRKVLRLEEEIARLKKDFSKKLAKEVRSRTINKHFLIHRLVATYFLPRPAPEATVVAHLDFNKLNNKVDNLKWMTPDENYEHQQKSPFVIAEKRDRKVTKRTKDKGMKLTSTQVMHIKLLLKKGVPVKQLVKTFKVSSMQIWRIKSGENWGHIKVP